MKTSNKLLLAALLVLLISLTFYNAALHAEYRKGTFRDPFKDFVTLNLKDFNALDLPAASQASVRIEPGPYRVRVYKPLNEFLQASQHGQQLTLALRFPNDDHSFLNAGQPAVVISCPTLVSLRTNATYSTDNHPKTNRTVADWNPQRVRVQGFHQDSLLVQAANGSQVELLNTTLQRLRIVATTGAPVLHLPAGNRIAQATLLLGARSHLELGDLTIPALRYQFSDSATVSLPGRALNN